MIVFLMRHAQAESGEELDPTRKLTDLGKDQARMMGKWLGRQADVPKLVFQSNMKRSQSTAKRVAEKLDVPIVTTFALDPDGSPEGAWRTIRKLSANHDAVLAVTHGPLIEKLFCYLIGCPSFSMIHFAHAAIAHFDTLPPMLKEAKGDYTYEEVEQKRLILGSGGNSGENCEFCEEAADRGWVDMDDVFEGPDGDVDESPLHPNCDCTTEQKTRRVRVYENGFREAVSDDNPFRAYFHWLVTPNTVARDDDEMDIVTEAAIEIAEAALEMV